MILNLGRYINLTEIGRGAQGVVYKGYDTVIERIVAAKTAGNLDEAKNLGKLHHPNITMIYDVEKFEDTHFIFMEYVNGVTLKDIIAEQHKLPMKEKIKIIILIARALHYAHQNGIIHKDIKPANIMVIDNSQIKIMDFGIATTETKATDSSKTYLTGTPHYMSPEQLFGQPLNRQTDIYSLCVLAYEIFTGRKPFIAESLKALFKTVLNDTPVPLHEIDSSIPHEVSRIVLRGLEKNKEDRYASAADLADDLELFLHAIEKEECADLPELTDDDMRSLIISLKDSYTFFCDFTPNEIYQLMNMSTIVYFPKAEVIFKEGMVGQKMYIVVSGNVTISRNVAGREETIATLGQGACFGEMAIMDQALRSATATAQTDCTAIEINEVVLRKTSEGLCFKLYRNLSSVISERLRQVNTKCSEMEIQLRRTKTRQIRCAIATSLMDSGCFESIIPVYSQREGIEIHVLPVSSGLALELGKRGRIDMAFAALTEEQAEGLYSGGGFESTPPYGRRMDMCFVEVHRLRQNDLILVGHYTNPAKLRSGMSPQEALVAIAQCDDCLFISRGDNSGVYMQEMAMWKTLGIEPQSRPWYIETRQLMSDTLRLTERLTDEVVEDCQVCAGFKYYFDVRYVGAPVGVGREVNHLDFVLVTEFSVRDLGPEYGVHFGHVGPPGNDGIGMVHIVVVTGWFVDPKCLHKANNGTCHAVSGIGVYIVASKAALHKLYGCNAFHDGILSGTKHGYTGRA
ncbi:cyclic nucleotide-binding protein,protein kinase family protein [Candidatus Magnetobacterium bavaricum]|uniref:non-specific serine/threonine protein kinase n=1 Tax=Candidatus Magnetobacterium bavaricum TaxID=29290 RepID=A0A0F3GVU6_9BACT|nr:cyclic nucleotide-binding protein,protein kinase family protein [Candidatus Magnetobacterium bavaricum]